MSAQQHISYLIDKAEDGLKDRVSGLLQDGLNETIDHSISYAVTQVGNQTKQFTGEVHKNISDVKKWALIFAIFASVLLLVILIFQIIIYRKIRTPSFAMH